MEAIDEVSCLLCVLLNRFPLLLNVSLHCCVTISGKSVCGKGMALETSYYPDEGFAPQQFAWIYCGRN